MTVCSLHGQVGTRGSPPVGGAWVPTLSIIPAVRHTGGWGCGVRSVPGKAIPESKNPPHRTLAHPTNRHSAVTRSEEYAGLSVSERNRANTGGLTASHSAQDYGLNHGKKVPDRAWLYFLPN